MGPSSRTYYVDSEKGDDRTTGVTPQQAWRSLARVNEVDLAPGEQVLFAGGQKFAGTLFLGREDSGERNRRIRVSSFGEGRAVIDGGTTRSILQYNLSYNNHGCGYLLCQYPGAADWKDNVCRYNISVNDGLTNHFSGIYCWADDRNMSDAQVYNNVVINSRHAVSTAHDIPGLVFRNNILMVDEVAVVGPLDRAIFENNLYRVPARGAVFRHGDRVFKTPAEWAQACGKEMVDGRLVALTGDPRLVLPGHLKDLPTNPRQLANMSFYRWQTDSPCLGAGTIIADNGGRDLFGNPVDTEHRPALGVHERR